MGGVAFAVVVSCAVASAQTQGPMYFKSTNRCLIGGYYQDCPMPERPPAQSERKEKRMKFTIVAAVPLSTSADGKRKVVRIDTYELTGYEGRHAKEDAEAVVRRACNNRCEIRSITEEEEK